MFEKQLSLGFKYAVFQYADSDTKYLLDVKTAKFPYGEGTIICNWFNVFSDGKTYHGKEGGFNLDNCKCLKFYKNKPKMT